MHKYTRAYHIREHLYMLPGFGLAKKNMGKLKTKITIGTKNKAGELLYPYTYVIKTKEALKFDTMFSNGERVHKVPFNACKIIGGDYNGST